jgi:hypothetical protein
MVYVFPLYHDYHFDEENMEQQQRNVYQAVPITCLDDLSKFWWGFLILKNFIFDKK